MRTIPDGGTVTTFASDEGPPPRRASRLYPHLGTTVDGRYKVERALGEGGMGVVYVARDLKFASKCVALKILKIELAEDELVVDRFFNEAQAASSIGSPHIVQVLDFGSIAGDGTPYIVMELLEGRSLAKVLDEARVLPEGRVVSVAKQMAAGLAVAHEKGIVHRDLKPDNVQIVATSTAFDFVKILDFGIAKLENRSTKLTKVGTVFGTPHYMAPEQCAGLAVDGRSDVYGLGIMMFEMLAGRVPFDQGPHTAILSHHLYKPPPSVRELAPRPVSAGMEAIVQKCLTKKAAGRYASMRDLAADLERLEGGIAPLAEAEMKARPSAYDRPADYFAPAANPPARKERSPFLGIAVGVGLAIGLVAIGATVLRGRGAATSPGNSSGLTMVPSSPLGPAPLVERSANANTNANTISIAIAVSPADAEVRTPDGHTLAMREGVASYEPKNMPETLVVTRAGFVSRSIELGAGSPALVRVDLAGVPRAAPGHRSAPAPITAPASPPSKPAALRRSDCFVDGKLAPYPECRAFESP